MIIIDVETEESVKDPQLDGGGCCNYIYRVTSNMSWVARLVECYLTDKHQTRGGVKIVTIKSEEDLVISVGVIALWGNFVYSGTGSHLS